MSTIHRPARLVALSLIAAACLLPVGCMLPYAYPHVERLPSVHVATAPAEVHAFHVAARGKSADFSADTEEYSLCRVPLSADGRVPAQTSLDVNYGVYVIGVALNYPIHYTHFTRVRLYRPGYALVEVKPGTDPGKVEWKPAADLAAREKAVDDLLSEPFDMGLAGRMPMLDKPGASAEVWSISRLSPGSASPAEREALVFAAGEYERLVLLPGSGLDGETKERLMRKAQQLRQQAAR
jgi:hypothetical protein